MYNVWHRITSYIQKHFQNKICSELNNLQRSTTQNTKPLRSADGDAICSWRPPLLLVLCSASKKTWKTDTTWQSVLVKWINNFDKEQWKQHFWMFRSMFDYVLPLIRYPEAKIDFWWQKSFEPLWRTSVKTVAFALWWYATPSIKPSTGCLGFGIVTVCMLGQVTAALKKHTHVFWCYWWDSHPCDCSKGRSLSSFQLEKRNSILMQVVVQTHSKILLYITLIPII